VFIDVSDETHYVEIIENLLNNNDETLEKLWIKRGDVETSRLNFPRFLNRTIWEKERFPVKTKFTPGYAQKKKETRQAVAAAAADQQVVAVGLQGFGAQV
jgi:hypothetical protein